MMSSYFDFFCKNIESAEDQNTDQIVGTCNLMCPEDEINLREVERLVHVLEVWGMERKLVKSYSRSAADSNMAVPHLLRPYAVLINTVQFLLLEITRRKDVPASVVYDFVDDRLRAVRQDMTIQRLPPEQCVNLLEPMIRFYVYYSHKLSNLPLKDYDPALNKKSLLECMKWYLSSCDTIDENKKLDELSGLLSHLDLNRNTKLTNDRVLIESLYIVCNLNDLHPLYRYVHHSKQLRREPKLQLAYEIAITNLQGNYIKVCRLLDKVCPLTYCALFTYLPTLQRNALEVLSHAYNNKRLTIPSEVLVHWLHFADEFEAQAVCAHYGLKVEKHAVRFDKTDFAGDSTLHQLKLDDNKKLGSQSNQKFEISIIDIFTYTTSK
ncbi:germinal-center associated nuclear protein [Trichoplusia ni]|uniref:Germinal-center associated nuclear protein n=1 Tax=Trichoplusia ni TaxID=7111 RepID=A0A7E5WP52_TRINI|nr:germinal-center associated nuclear protein [Trichoplusia ni]